MSLALFSLSFHFGAFATVGCRRNLRPCVRAELGAKLWPGPHGKVRWNGASSWKSRLLQVVLFSVSCPFLCYLSIFRAKVLFLHVQTTQGAIGNLSPTGEWFNDALYRVHDPNLSCQSRNKTMKPFVDFVGNVLPKWMTNWTKESLDAWTNEWMKEYLQFVCKQCTYVCMYVRMYGT